jgi:hypothetical protein
MIDLLRYVAALYAVAVVGCALIAFAGSRVDGR